MVNADAYLKAEAHPGRLSVARALSEEAPAWDDFVERQREARFCHLWGFRQALERAYGYRCVYLKILSEGKLVGVFPSVARRAGRGRLVSQPFNEYGGPLTEDFSGDQYQRLAEMLLGVAREEGCKSIEIRGGIGSEAAAQAGCWIKKPLHSYALLNLDHPSRLWRHSLTHEARKAVHQAQKARLSVDIRRGSQAVADPFFELYQHSMKRLGVPPHPLRLFTELANGLGDRLVAAWVMSQGRAVAILLGMKIVQRLQVWVTVSDTRCWSLRPNDLAHWELICWAFGEGLRVFDFGSARYPGQIQFKKKWGAGLREYSWYLIGLPNQAETIGALDASSKSMTALATLWRWMVPVGLTRLLGPPIRKYLTR